MNPLTRLRPGWRSFSWEAAAVRGAMRRAVAGPGPERDTAVQSLKAAVAATLAWAVTGWWWGAPMALMAPWAAVVLVQSTVYRSLRSALQQVAVVTVGTLLAAGAAMLTGNTLAAMAVALPLTALLGNYARFGEQGLYAPTTALFVLAYGSYSGFDILHRLLETLIGAAIGIAVNALVLPPVHSRSVRHLLDRLPRDAADLLHTVADEVADGYDRGTAEAWYDRAWRLSDTLADLHTARRWAHESYRFNPAQRLRRRAVAPPAADWDFTWDHVAEHIRTVARTLLEAAPGRPTLSPPPGPALKVLAGLLAAAGDTCAAESGPERRRALDTAYDAHERLAQSLREQDGDALPALGGLTAGTKHLLNDLTAWADGDEPA